MPYNDWPQDVHRLYAELAPKIQEIAQTAATAEAVLYATDRDEAW
jgi:hypothetical protein